MDGRGITLQGRGKNEPVNPKVGYCILRIFAIPVSLSHFKIERGYASPKSMPPSELHRRSKNSCVTPRF